MPALPPIEPFKPLPWAQSQPRCTCWKTGRPDAASTRPLLQHRRLAEAALRSTPAAATATKAKEDSNSGSAASVGGEEQRRHGDSSR